MANVAYKQNSSDFGSLLKKWRKVKGFSQLDLAMAADSSARHISFIETGRSQPSREMVLRLAVAMEVPLRDRNRLLNEAGYRSAYTERPLEGKGLEQIKRALSFILDKQEPYPALVMNRCFDILMINHTGAKFVSALGLQLGGQNGPPNILRMSLHPDGFRNVVKDWEQSAGHMIHRAYRQLRGQDENDRLAILLKEVLAYPGVPESFQVEDPTKDALPVLPIEFMLNGLNLSWITTVASFGTPQDVTAEEVMVECMFPSDEQTDRFAKALSNGNGQDLI
ncbi:helix-turn-helix domain-containing protein [Sneathiella limimaris]|uniref:helix-turn-helix domain-containing protein n=1 Tax=Sneathiella limimaris TaxID=1964213 RepID=UPI00146BB8A6|nr:helix-turn-helix transcriptional regulator [Sneathiella limimaris]